MNTAIDALSHRLELLLDGLHFRSDFAQALHSPEQLTAIGEHNLREYEKSEAVGEERVRNILSNILASVLQDKAITKYGNTDPSSIRQVLNDWFDQPEDRVYWSRLRPTFRQALAGCNLTDDQYQIVMEYIFGRLPQLIIEALADLVSPLYFLPRTEAQSIAMVLSDIIKEEAS